MNPDNEHIIRQLSLMWETPSFLSPLNFSSQFATNTTGFNVNWMLHQISHEILLAQHNPALSGTKQLYFQQQISLQSLLDNVATPVWDLRLLPFLDFSVETLL